MRLGQIISTLAATALIGMTGCAYRLAAPLVVSSQQRLRLVGPAPEGYALRIQSADYRVPPDGRLTFSIRMVHRGCSVYLFNHIPLQRVPDPMKEKIVAITMGGKAVRLLSFQELSKLPLDSEGYHQVLVSLTHRQTVTP